jgi:protein SCO1/2
MNRQKILFAVLVGLLLIGIGLYQYTLPPLLHGSVIEPPKPMPDFTLTSTRGPVSLTDFRGKIVVLYFGYTGCPDVCPTTLAALRQALNGLGESASQVQVLFIAVDWKRDTPERVAAYLSAFRPDFIGLGGSQAEMDTATQAFGIHYQLNPPDENGYYTVDHTASQQILDRQGNLVMVWPYGLTGDEMLDDLKVLIRK